MGTVSNNYFVELDIETGKVLYEWASLDHVSPHGKICSVDSSRFIDFPHIAREN
jgi:hypothetical protein